MTYIHLTTDELVLIESYYHQAKKVKHVADTLKRSRQAIYNVYNALNEGLSILDYYQRYKKIKRNVEGVLFLYLIMKQNIFKTKWLKDGLLT